MLPSSFVVLDIKAKEGDLIKGGSFLDHLRMKTTSVAFVILQLPLNLLPRSLLFDVVIIYFVPLPTI